MNSVEFRDLCLDHFGKDQKTISRSDVIALGKKHGVENKAYNLVLNAKNRVGRGVYSFPDVVPVNQPQSSPISTKAADMSVKNDAFTENLVPEVDPLFVPFGNFSMLSKILASGMFYPAFVTGLSGNGKTYLVEQACAKNKREVIRVNFTVETDEDDLIGGFRLVNGETKFFKGPVIKAMEIGAVLLCDEIDLANPAKVMCLQSILEGAGYFIKKTGEYIKPAPGFTVIATANTKGKGSDDGRFIGTNILNEAFLERFPVTCEQEYPSPAIEKKILGKVAESLSIVDSPCSEDDVGFIPHLVAWADIVRKTFSEGGCDEIISTRRLVHILKAYSIFGDRTKAIDLCINRFDDETKLAFRELYSHLDVHAVDKDETEMSDDA